MMRRTAARRLAWIAIIPFLALLVPLGSARADNTPILAQVVSVCGTPNGAPYVNNTPRAVTIDVNGNMCGPGSSSSTPVTVTDTAKVTASGGTAAGNANQAAGVHNSVALSLSNGQGAALQLYGTGDLEVDNSPRIQTPLGYQQIASFSTAQTLTAPGTATWASIICEGNEVRYRDDGTAPTATVGQPLAVLAPLPYYGNLAAWQVIPVTGNATCNILYYKNAQ